MTSAFLLFLTLTLFPSLSLSLSLLAVPTVSFLPPLSRTPHYSSYQHHPLCKITRMVDRMISADRCSVKNSWNNRGTPRFKRCTGPPPGTQTIRANDLLLSCCSKSDGESEITGNLAGIVFAAIRSWDRYASCGRTISIVKFALLILHWQFLDASDKMFIK